LVERTAIFLAAAAKVNNGGCDEAKLKLDGCQSLQQVGGLQP